MLRTFLTFARLHTVVGTTLSVVVLFLMAYRAGPGDYDFPLLVLSLFSCLCANVYITGLNQLTDVAIDRINKPYLPLASGAYSIATGRNIVRASGLLAVFTCFFYPPWLTATVLISMAIGTAYSLPPLRLKQYHFWAAFCIIAVRGLVVNLLLYLHFRAALGGSVNVPGAVWLLTLVIFVFGVVIAWFKDLPDTEGDARHGIRTLSLVRDRGWVFRRGSGLLVVTFWGVAAGALLLGLVQLAIFQAILVLVYGWLARRLDLDEPPSIARFYQGVWGLFFAEYVLFGLYG